MERCPVKPARGVLFHTNRCDIAVPYFVPDFSSLDGYGYMQGKLPVDRSCLALERQDDWNVGGPDATSVMFCSVNPISQLGR